MQSYSSPARFRASVFNEKKQKRRGKNQNQHPDFEYFQAMSILEPVTATESLNLFEEQGFFRLPGFISPPLLEKLQCFFDELMSGCDKYHQMAVNRVNGKDYITNIDNPCARQNGACLELLGLPALLELAESICGIDFFPIQDFAVVKMLGDTLPVLWHQDMLHQRRGKCFTIGIYLDDADSGDGCLKLVPGSHLKNEDICTLKDYPSIEAPVKAGDVMVHDMMVAHASDPMSKNEKRRVIYFEFLSAAHVAAENLYTTELVNRRSWLVETAASYYRQLHPESDGYNFKRPFAIPEVPGLTLEQIMAVIYDSPVRAHPSRYCFDMHKPGEKFQ